MKELTNTLENFYTIETEEVECECCGNTFERALDTDYTVCSKACLREMQAEARGDI
jgi:hypothetical protein